MGLSEALKTTFKGDRPATQVVIPLSVAEADHGSSFSTDEEFAQWIDDNNDRIYASAFVKRETDTLYETVTLAEGDILLTVPAEFAESKIISTGDQEEVRVISNDGHPDEAEPLFVGHIHDAVSYIYSLPGTSRDTLIIWTEGRIYGSHEFPRMRREVRSS